MEAEINQVAKALAQANDAKAEGNQLFVAGQFEDALSKYELALYFAQEMPSSAELRSICHSNRAVCFSKQGKYEEAIKEGTKALDLNTKNLKALIRRGEAHEKLKHFDESISDMKRILELDPSNSQAREAIQRLESLASQKQEKIKEEFIANVMVLIHLSAIYFPSELVDMGNSLFGMPRGVPLLISFFFRAGTHF
ncbi:hypothetical protein ACHQM5_015825 [Ranunculus cassubicifolius]